jgi:hypothetical protein
LRREKEDRASLFEWFLRSRHLCKWARFSNLLVGKKYFTPRAPGKMRKRALVQGKLCVMCPSL